MTDKIVAELQEGLATYAKAEKLDLKTDHEVIKTLNHFLNNWKKNDFLSIAVGQSVKLQNFFPEVAVHSYKKLVNSLIKNYDELYDANWIEDTKNWTRRYLIRRGFMEFVPNMPLTAQDKKNLWKDSQDIRQRHDDLYGKTPRTR